MPRRPTQPVSTAPVARDPWRARLVELVRSQGMTVEQAQSVVARERAAQGQQYTPYTNASPALGERPANYDALQRNAQRDVDTAQRLIQENQGNEDYQQISGREFSRIAPSELHNAFEVLMAQRDNVDESTERYRVFSQRADFSPRSREHYQQLYDRRIAEIERERSQAERTLRDYATANPDSDLLRYFTPEVRQRAIPSESNRPEGYEENMADAQRQVDNAQGLIQGNQGDVGQVEGAPSPDPLLNPPGTTVPGTVTDPAVLANQRDAAFAFIDNALATGQITDAEARLFKQTWEGIDPNKEVNFDNILSEFKRISRETIDPEFARQVNQFTQDALVSKGQLDEARRLELEQERTNEGEAIRQAQGNLEQRGMTFTGEGIRQLGKESAFAQPGAEGAATSAIPLQQDFQGGFFEGLIPQSSRLVRTSTEARFIANQRQLGRQAEGALGSTEAGSLGFQGLVGGDIGDIERQKQQEKAQRLGQLSGQQGILNQAERPVAYTLFNQ
mgnify:FL=1